MKLALSLIALSLLVIPGPAEAKHRSLPDRIKQGARLNRCLSGDSLACVRSPNRRDSLQDRIRGGTGLGSSRYF
ncbi:MAG: hypothetical protein EOP11_15960 [Proteobacteria bacterium]|nr:MAG: hypothetical protein EOP11_15960 [Pseudomonadota bacterium]